MTEQTRQAPTFARLQTRRDEILAVAHRYGASNVRIFGSVARNTATPDSDVDVLATFPDQTSIFDLVGMWLELQDLLGCSVSLISDETPDERFMHNVLQDAIAL